MVSRLARVATLLSAGESHTAAHGLSGRILLDNLQLFADTHPFHGFLQPPDLVLVVEVHRILNWQDGIAQSAVALAAISCER